MSALCCVPVAIQGPSGRERKSYSDFFFFLKKRKIFKASRVIICRGYMLMSFTES